jgi:NAD(P)-dependent dehydrogenase (short-subunit alcohol dehydrogenase family)
MSMDHAGQRAGPTAVVTGAARGVGQAVAQALAEHGAYVALGGQTAATVEAAATEIGHGAFAILGDMRRPDDVRGAHEATLARTGRIDVLVCDAGISGPPAPVLEMAEEACWAEMLAVNLAGPMPASRLMARAMARRGGGSSSSTRPSRPRCRSAAS